ncbi:hypothetical protein PC129_g1212 [Phytophthora cactorum]|uniref:Uncharacterized protein n=1 Tax=Phytophthora cactorum TaxID=29920 RepID=A0A8T1LPP9_9STRA|nr:hypothetical protein PC114_g1924 [Phytophthora cactorum]KAG2952784.1 hypothetical protein PC117_g2543 [Phytophthora cactorum]KAG3033123.1 hypothetical protein PC120_g2076 [Phytophthora cactorum]KAG3038968.1 hypothetical protein PC119_g2543 [Phytophthora cactorum]KAG3190782.1 hypothetical protein C6341_g1603 [Phytophthora cactorum]
MVSASSKRLLENAFGFRPVPREASNSTNDTKKARVSPASGLNSTPQHASL